MKAAAFIELLSDHGVRFFTGVPDSTLEPLCSYLSTYLEPQAHIVAANEGGAVALASGYHLATGGIPLVYLQNSGLGNAINPLLSLADPRVYSIPMLLIVGWRGKPGTKDEPQHVKQGEVHESLLQALDIPNVLLDDEGKVEDIITCALEQCRARSGPVVLTSERSFWSSEPSAIPSTSHYTMTREEVLEELVTYFKEDLFFSTTGKTSRELYELRESRQENHARDFLTVGSMGHCSQIALGVALYRDSNDTRRIVCVDGDGAMLMHLGNLGIIGSLQPRHFVHVLINNGAHESVGAQPTVGFGCHFDRIARDVGYAYSSRAETLNELRRALEEIKGDCAPAFLEVRVKTGSRGNLGRPKESPQENKVLFMTGLRAKNVSPDQSG